MNKVELTGRLTRDVEIRYTKGENPMAVANFTIAVKRKFKHEGEPEADFIPCVSFGKSAEFSSKYFKKGMMVGITGKIQTSSWKDDKGQTHFKTAIIIEEQEFLESKASFESRTSDTSAEQEAGYMTENVEDDDLPF